MSQPIDTDGGPVGARRPVLQSMATFTVAGVVLALSLGFLDGVAGLIRGQGSSPGVILLALALHAPLGVLLGLPLGLAAGAIRSLIPRERSPLWTHLRRNAAADRAVAAGLLAGSACLLLETLLVYAFGGSFFAAMANRRLAALATGLTAGAGLVLCALAFFPLLLALRRLLRPLPRHATLLVLALLLLALGGGVSLVLGSLDWRVIRFAPFLVLAALAAGIPLLALTQLHRESGWGRLRPLLLALLIGGGLGLAAPVLGRDDATVSAAQQGGWLSPQLIGWTRALADGDGDGYSAWLGGGDCDDGNPAVHPGATDLPGNGIDENCSGGDATPPPARRPPRPRTATRAFSGNVLLICIDTLRGDRLGAAGHRGGLTPNLDRMARDGILFREAIAQGPNTPQSFPSIFTSRYPTRVPFRQTFTGYPELGEEAVTFFEVLRQGGIRTAAVTSHFYFTDKRGITQGVEAWDNRDATNLKDSNKDISAPRIVPRALAKLQQLAAKPERFILFVHLFEPHSTYVVHPEYPITERGVRGLEQKYDHEIKFVDRWLGTLLDGLGRAGLTEKTAVVVFGDHAEAFGEHRLYFHGQTLYHEVLHVPLVLRLPGWKPRVVSERVALLDLAPTILELMGVPVPEAFQGISLLPLAAADPGLSAAKPGPPPRRIGAVLMPYPAWPKGWHAMYRGQYKAIFRFTENRFEAYDLTSDPGEQRDLSRDRPALAAELRRELGTFVEQELQ